MTGGSPEPRLIDIIEAIELITQDMAGVGLDAFQRDVRTRRMVERCIEIISEASRHLDDALKARHPQIPWRKVAAIGNILRHEYERVAADIIWRVVNADLPDLEEVCRTELASVRSRDHIC